MKTHHIVAALFLCLLVTGCNAKSNVNSQSLDADKVKTAQTERVVARLLDYYSQWQGVPHCNGGTSKEGVDSCGFTYMTFREKFGIRLPRSTSQLANTGTAINRMHLQPGDLVFFKIDMGARHVGIYVDEQKFMHSSKGEGVMMSSMDNPYWQKRYWQSRRIAAL
jgi:cell wall-associated NlpC family hydrolase